MKGIGGHPRLLCERCSRTFKSVITLRRHVEVCYQRNAEPRFQCAHCPKRFRTQVQCTRHCYYTHTLRRFPCTEPGCGRVFPTDQRLSKHMLIHSSDRPYECPYPGCGYRARTDCRLLQHKLVHGEGRRFACDYCDYTATTSSNLRRHARLHAGAKPYLCPHCPHRTCSIDALAKHVLDSSRHPGLPLYVCPWCPQSDPKSTSSGGECVGFNATNLAWRHLVTEHSDQLATLEASRRFSRSADGTLLERDVTVLLGIYRPDLDFTRPHEGAIVRQPIFVSRFRRKVNMPSPIRRRLDTMHKQTQRFGDVSHSSVQQPTEHGTASRPIYWWKTPLQLQLMGQDPSRTFVIRTSTPVPHVLKTISL